MLLKIPKTVRPTKQQQLDKLCFKVMFHRIRKSYSKIQLNRMIISNNKIYSKKTNKSLCLKWAYWLFGSNSIVAALSKLYLTVTWIIMPSLKSKGQFYLGIWTDYKFRNA